MQLEEFESTGADPTPSLADFTSTSIEFALFHPRYRFDVCEVTLSTEGAFTTRCGITAIGPELGTISAGVIGRDEFDAVARASDLLALEVDRRIAERETPPLITARPTRRPTIPSAPLPTATCWGIA